MAGEAVILKSEYPDQLTTACFEVDINQAADTVTRHLVFDKRVVIDAIDVVGLKVGAAKGLEFYSIPLAGDLYDVSTGTKITADVDLDAATWTGPDGAARTASATATGWVSLAMTTTANKLEAGTVLAIKQTGDAAASKNPQVLVRYRERIS